MTNVVKSVFWRLRGTDGTNDAFIQGNLEVGSPTPGDFTPYNDLTQHQVIIWVKDTLGQQAINEMLATIDAQLQEMANPAIITPPLPWS
jgi:hypothetical protein